MEDTIKSIKVIENIDFVIKPKINKVGFLEYY